MTENLENFLVLRVMPILSLLKKWFTGTPSFPFPVRAWISGLGSQSEVTDQSEWRHCSMGSEPPISKHTVENNPKSGMHRCCARRSRHFLVGWRRLPLGDHRFTPARCPGRRGALRRRRAPTWYAHPFFPLPSAVRNRLKP